MNLNSGDPAKGSPFLYTNILRIVNMDSFNSLFIQGLQLALSKRIGNISDPSAIAELWGMLLMAFLINAIPPHNPGLL